MATETEQLVVSLEARVRDFERNFQKASRTANSNWTAIERRSSEATGKLEKAMTAASGRVASFARGLQGSLAATLGLGGLGGAAIIGTLTGAVSDLAKVAADAKRAGLGSETFQALAFAARQSNVEIDALTDGMKELQLRADEFIVTGKGSAAEAFQRIGLTPEELKTRLRDPADLLNEITNRIQTLDKAAQLRIFDELFGGTGGEQFTRFIDQGIDGVKRLAAEARSTGNVLSEETINKAVELDRKFAKIASTVGTALKGAIVEAAEALGDFIERFRALESRTDIKQLQAEIGRIYNEREALSEHIAKLRGDLEKGVVAFSEADRAIIERTIAQDEKRIAALNDEAGKYLDRITALQGRGQPTPPATPPAPSGGYAGGLTVPGNVAKVVDGYETIRKAALARIATLETELDTTGKTAAETARLRFEQELLAEAQSRGLTVTADQRAEIADLASKYGALTASLEAVTTTQEQAAERAQFFGDLGVEAFGGLVRGADSLKSALDGILNKLIDASIQAALLGQGPLASLFGMSAAPANGIGGILGALFGGFRADGGPVSPGRAYVVGERGPEIFTPRSAGVVSANRSLGGGRSITLNAPINVRVEGGSRGVEMDRRLAESIRRQVEHSIRQVVVDELGNQLRTGGVLTMLS